MKKILFITIPEKGHINPMIGVAQNLQSSGYELAFFAQQDISKQLKKAGLHGPVYCDPSAVNIDKDFITQGKAFVERLADKTWLHNWIKTLLLDSVVPQMQQIKTAVEQFQPQLIVTDPMIYAAAVVAHQSAIPWVGLSSSLNPITPLAWRCELTDTLELLAAQRCSLLESYGLTPHFRVSDLISPWLNIVFSTEHYMPRALCENDFSFYVGNTFPLDSRGDETDFPFDRLKSGAKKVYMSLGSQIYYHPHLFRAVAHALNDKDIQLICSISELFHTPFPEQLPENVLCVAYTPQIELLKHVDLMITHGGANSVMESLAQGVPVALLPICNDQFLQAAFVRRLEAGIVLDPVQPSSTAYRQQLLPLLEPSSLVKGNAAKIASSFKERGGASEAAALIERLFTTREPLQPV